MLESRRRYNREHATKLKMDDSKYQARLARIRDNPTPDDIDSGDALNMILDQMSDPRVMQGSSLRLANATVSPQAIREIPFRDETDAITLSLDEMTDPKNWPLPLHADTFKPEREAYQKAVDDALEEDKDGSLKPETVARVRNAVAALYQKVGETIPKTQKPEYTQAMNYLKGLAGMSRMLEKPNVEAVLAELEKVQSTTVGNLVAFMHTYNLRFAPATTPKQRAIYRDLMPAMVESRDKILGKPGDANANAGKTPPRPVENPTALFHGFDPTHLNPAREPPVGPEGAANRRPQERPRPAAGVAPFRFSPVPGRSDLGPIPSRVLGWRARGPGPPLGPALSWDHAGPCAGRHGHAEGIRLMFGGVALLAAAGGDAHSQYYYPFGYGYGGYGFGGWGETPQGSIARGLGVYAAGQGVYNYDTAVAGSINTDTVIRYNQYLYNSMLEARRRYYREHARKLAMDDAHYNARQARIRDNPSGADIDSGDAMNTILDQLADPKMLHGSELRLANAKISRAVDPGDPVPRRDRRLLARARPVDRPR